MGPKPTEPETDELFISRLDELINMRHPLVHLAFCSFATATLSSPAQHWPKVMLTWWDKSKTLRHLEGKR